ncbi:MAG: hypothetical protein PVJ04_08455 [Gemmatimonadota bacterium]|jgi:hypothetical protein
MVPFVGILAGFSISLVVAAFAVPWVLDWLRRDLEGESAPGEETVPAWVVGTVERAFFTVVVAAGLSGVVIAMILWIAAKMAAGWGSDAQGIQNSEAFRFTALLGDLVSMIFALVGGGVVRMGWLLMV